MKWSQYLGEDGYVIYLFHGVIPAQTHPVRNYTRKHIPVDEFGAILDDLSRAGTPVAMGDIRQAGEAGTRLPPRAFAITFDDGFENNVSVALPQLERRKIPATFYVTTDFVDRNCLGWIDQVEQGMEAAADVVLDMPKYGIVGRARTVQEKNALLDVVRVRMKTRSDADLYAFAEAAVRQMGVNDPEPDRWLDQKMTWAQVRDLHRHPLCLVGGHSHCHRILSFLSARELERDIETSLCLLQEKAGVGPVHYSYPEGLIHCYSPAVIACLKEQGVRCCPTAIEGMNRVGADLFHLKRIMVS